MRNLLIILLVALLAAACGSAPSNNTVANTGNQNSASAPAQVLTVTERPAHISEMASKRGEQDNAAPSITIAEPKEGATIASSTVKVELTLEGDLKGYMPHKDAETQMGNHIHVILDNQPYEAYYLIKNGPFELRNVSDGEHTLRVFPSRPWHESYKNEGAFKMVRFTVKNGGANSAKPATTNTGQPMSTGTPEGKEMKTSIAGPVEAAKPLLTYSRPKAEYKGIEADPIMIDFWLIGGKLTGDGGDLTIRMSVDNAPPQTISKWAPVWFKGWQAGNHTVKLELLDQSGNVIDNGGYNRTTREITVVK